VREHWFKRFINHHWVVAIGPSLIPLFLKWIVSLNFSGYVGNFFKVIRVVLGYTFAIPAWLVLTVAILAVTSTAIILFKNRTPRKYLCECTMDCTYQGKYVKKGQEVTSTEKNPAHFQLVKKRKIKAGGPYLKRAESS
jgi:hypothetical protein